jgi:hypothetical protein
MCLFSYTNPERNYKTIVKPPTRLSEISDFFLFIVYLISCGNVLWGKGGFLCLGVSQLFNLLFYPPPPLLLEFSSPLSRSSSPIVSFCSQREVLRPMLWKRKRFEYRRVKNKLIVFPFLQTQCRNRIIFDTGID